MIQMAKKEHLTQEQLGKLVGVKKAQISRLENKTGNMTIETILKIFHALGSKINVNVQLLHKNLIFPEER
jgi:HTH-type transcriptional regulator/antitoxin HipB